MRIGFEFSKLLAAGDCGPGGKRGAVNLRNAAAPGGVENRMERFAL